MQAALWIIVVAVLATHTSAATVYKCKHPVTNAVEFSDKPCNDEQKKTLLDSKLGDADELSRKNYQSLSTADLASELDDLEQELSTTRSMLVVSSTRPSRSSDVNKLQRDLLSEHTVWYENRDTTCNKEHRKAGVASSVNRDIVLCKIAKTEERLAQFLKHSRQDDWRGLLGNTDRVTLLPGKAGLMKAVREGVIKLARDSDLSIWMRKAGITHMSERFKYMDKYLLTEFVTFSGGLGGANSAILLVKDSTVLPAGDTGHSLVLVMDTGTCVGVMCSMIR